MSRLHDTVTAAVSYVAAHQLSDGALPWWPGGDLDPWDHVECAMALDVGGRAFEAERAYRWLQDVQLDDGSMFAGFRDGVPHDRSRDTNSSTYVAVGAWHHYLSTGDRRFLRDLWPTVVGAIEFALGLQAEHGGIYWSRDEHGKVWRDCLVTGSSSVRAALWCAERIAEVLGESEGTRWRPRRLALEASFRDPGRNFDTWEDDKGHFAMDWYYPVLCGILSGIDVAALNPAADPHLAATFDAGRLDLRVENKLALQRRLGLPEGGETPVLAMVSRLFWQKGSDLAAAAVEDLLAAHPLQFVVLGQGDELHTQPLLALAARYPQQVAVRLDFDDPLGQLIFGGCDLFLMPSRYEPGGLGQLVAMRYGAVPIVRHTGGLADSVAPYEPAGAGGGQGTGFLVDEATPQALAAAIEQALAVYGDTEAWRRLQRRGMAQDFSWSRAAERYRDPYQRAVGLRAVGG